MNKKSIEKDVLSDLLLCKSKSDIASEFRITTKSVTRLILQYGLINPPYVQSVETKRLRAEAIKAAHRRDPALTERKTRGMKEHNQLAKGKTWEEMYSAEIASHMKEGCRKRMLGTVQSEETKEKRRLSLQGREMTPEMKRKMSDARKRGFAQGTLKLSPHAGCGKGGFKPDINHYVRSTYEHAFARWLKQHGIIYEYEPKTFALIIDGGNRNFMPDFLVGSIWVEIKNTFNVSTPEFKKKLQAFKEQHPHEKLFVLVGDKQWSGNDASAAIQSVMAAQSDLVEVVHTLKQVICVKG